MSEYGNKKPIYDEKIYPLMMQIIEICEAEGINMVASFQLQSKKEIKKGDLLCSTSLPENEEHYPEAFKAIFKILNS